MTDGEVLDAPSNRGYDWVQKSKQIKKQRGEVCEQCGKSKGKHGNGYIALETHHIVKGRHLPVSVARHPVNLVVVCNVCHGGLENRSVITQYQQTGKLTMANTLELLRMSDPILPTVLAERLDVDIFSAYGYLQAATKLRLARRTNTGVYEVAPDRLPYDAIRSIEDVACQHYSCNKDPVVKTEGYTGAWTPHCREHARGDTQIDLYELPDDPRDTEEDTDS